MKKKKEGKKRRTKINVRKLCIEYFFKINMDVGIGIGGMNVEKDEFVDSKFDLFGKTDYEVGIKKSVSQTFRPLSTTNSNGPFSFLIPSDPDKFTNVESLRLHGKMRIMKKDASTNALSNLTTEFVAPVNNIFNSLWSSINTKLNGCEITDPSSKWYAYKAYFEDHLSYSSPTKENGLSYKGYYKDTPNKFDDVGDSVNGKASLNDGFLKRKAMFAGSKWVYFCINLHTDITTLRKYIPPEIKIEMEFQRNTPEFCLLSDKPAVNYAIELADMRLKVDRIIPSEKIMNFYKKNKQNNLNPRLPIDRSLLKTYTVTGGRYDLSEYNIITGNQLPEQVIVAIVDEDAHNGNIAKNPFHFKDYDLSEASLVVNGIHEPQELYKLNKTLNDNVDMYASFLENTGISTDDREFGITMEDYYGGNFILVWDRTQDKCNRFHRHLSDTGSISINLKTRTVLPSSVTVIIYATYSKDLIIEGDRVLTAAF